MYQESIEERIEALEHRTEYLSRLDSDRDERNRSNMVAFAALLYGLVIGRLLSKKDDDKEEK